VTRFLVVIAPAAEGDIADAFLWYREQRPLIADAFRTEVFETIERISATAPSFASDGAGKYKRVLRRFPYSVHYEVAGDMVTILAVAHHRRRPGYWR
jgi:plasmid stabilization system protein ParE